MVKKIKPKYKQLEEKFGGIWEYNLGGHLWESDDGRKCWAVRSCSCDNELCGSSPQYYVYGRKNTEEMFFDGQEFSFCTSGWS